MGCGRDSHWYHGGIVSKLYSFYSYFKMKSVVKKSNFCLYVTDLFLQGRYPPNQQAKVTCVSNVELFKFDQKLLKKRTQRIKNNTGKITFGTIGSLTTNYKGIHIAMKALSKCDFDYEYRILGEGAFLEKYRKLCKELNIEDRIKFQGVLAERDQVFNWLDEIDIYLQPSLTEGLPRTLIEAMSRACPSIGSSSGGIPELLNKKAIFRTKDYIELRKIIKEVACNKLLQESYAIENFNNAKKYRKDILDYKRNKFWTDFNSAIN